jgi:hypothetical protein
MCGTGFFSHITQLANDIQRRKSVEARYVVRDKEIVKLINKEERVEIIMETCIPGSVRNSITPTKRQKTVP